MIHRDPMSYANDKTSTMRCLLEVTIGLFGVGFKCLQKLQHNGLFGVTYFMCKDKIGIQWRKQVKHKQSVHNSATDNNAPSGSAASDQSFSKKIIGTLCVLIPECCELLAVIIRKKSIFVCIHLLQVSRVSNQHSQYASPALCFLQPGQVK